MKNDIPVFTHHDIQTMFFKSTKTCPFDGYPYNSQILLEHGIWSASVRCLFHVLLLL